MLDYTAVGTFFTVSYDSVLSITPAELVFVHLNRTVPLLGRQVFLWIYYEVAQRVFLAVDLGELVQVVHLFWVTVNDLDGFIVLSIENMGDGSCCAAR